MIRGVSNWKFLFAHLPQVHKTQKRAYKNRGLWEDWKIFRCTTTAKLAIIACCIDHVHIVGLHWILPNLEHQIQCQLIGYLRKNCLKATLYNVHVQVCHITYIHRGGPRIFLRRGGVRTPCILSLDPLLIEQYDKLPSLTYFGEHSII